MLLVKAI